MRGDFQVTVSNEVLNNIARREATGGIISGDESAILAAARAAGWPPEVYTLHVKDLAKDDLLDLHENPDSFFAWNHEAVRKFQVAATMLLEEIEKGEQHAG